MPYLSQLLNSKVQDSADNVIGRLKDILIIPRPGEYDPLSFLAIKDKTKKKIFYVPYEYVENLSKRKISLKNIFNNINVAEIVPEDVIFLKQSVLDQQIVDVDGARVVRVNDLRLGIFKDKMSVLGVDISTRGLLRRLGLEWLNFFGLLKINFINWPQTQLVKGILKLDTVAKKLERLHPADLANIIEDLSLKDSRKLVESLDTESAAKVLEEVEPRFKKVLVKYLGPERATKILARMSADEVTDLIKTLTKDESSQLLEQLGSGVGKKVENLIDYDNDTAGGLMAVDFMTVSPEWNVTQAIEKIKEVSPTFRSILYIYVTGQDNFFFGAISLRRLLISSPDKKLEDLLKNYPATSILRPDQKFGEVVNIMTKYNLFTAVVLNKKHQLIGVVNIDDVMRHLAPQA